VNPARRQTPGCFLFNAAVPPCLIFEDEDLLVVGKPAGMNTHAPSPFAGEGIYEWLRDREPRWSTLAIVHRLDKETSGVLVFGKTSRANRSLTAQFTHHRIRKKYLLLTDRPVKRGPFTITSSLARAGEKQVSRPAGMGGERAETRFCLAPVLPPPFPGATVVVAEPVTGRTHQIRVHAAEAGFPVLGDTLYGGTSSRRVFLHAAELTLEHPADGREMTFKSPPAFEADARLSLREALVEPAATDAYRLIHGAADGWPGWYVDRLGGFILSQVEHAPTEAQRTELARLMNLSQATGAYHKILNRRVRATGTAEASPQLIIGEAATGPFLIRENGLQFELSFTEGYSVGLFLDQRDNRRRLLSGYVAAGFSHLGQGGLTAIELKTGTGGGHPLPRPERNERGEGQSLNQCEKTFDRPILAGPSASGYGVPALAGGAITCSGDLKNPAPTVSSHTPPPEGGTPYPDVSPHAVSGFQCANVSGDSLPKRGEEGEGGVVLDSDTRKPFGTGSAAEVLNVFAYTCGFSVCAARAGARVVSVDLSKKYLEWGRRNFALNGLDPAAHNFIYGDAFEWLRRLAKKNRTFDLIILDPPTFSQSKAGGAFQAEKDFGRLVRAALPLLKANGVLLASTNTTRLEPESFLAAIAEAVHSTARKIIQQHYAPQPPDFPINRAEPAYLKTVWIRVS